jgi:phage terminase large subunit GpA-like protein
MADFDYDGALDIERAWREGLLPDPLLTVSEWSDRHRMLSSKASAEPGRWRTSRTPYLKAIMDCLSPMSAVERIVFMKGAQLGAPLALTTPVPTPTGWTTMGDLLPGDFVFAEDGQPCRVTGVSPVLLDRECFEIEFADSETIVSDASHRWPIVEDSDLTACRNRAPSRRPRWSVASDSPVRPVGGSRWLPVPRVRMVVPAKARSARSPPSARWIPSRCAASRSIHRVTLYLCGHAGIPTHNTEMGNNWIGYVIHHAPGPMMAVSPTVDMAKRNSKQRIDPLIEESPVLAELIAPARSRDAGNTILAKEFRGGVLVMTGANSAVGLRSMPVRYLFLDEVDGYPSDVDGEGDAISLAEARTRTFARRKIFIVSTPTIAGASAIEREYEASDQRRYFLPCPHCDHRQWLRFEQLRWEKGRPETAAYVCESCETPIPEHHKTAMLEHGEWRATAPENGKTAGFHLSSLYSPIGWRSWREIAAAWESAVSKESGSSAAIKTFKNTELGETWVEEGEAPDWQRLVERREDYPMGRIPAGGLLLVGGADVQKDRIEASIWAFGRGKESWLIEHRVLMGDTARDSVWKRLGELIAETWTHASGAQVPLARFALDTGFATQEAYAFVRACHDPRLMAVKGVARGAALIGTPTAVEVSLGGKRLRRGIKLFSVVGGIAKLELYNNLKKTPEVADDGTTLRYPAGYVHLPKIDAEYLQQLCAEQLVTRRDRRGFAIREWQKMRERNEGVDCYQYARAAAAAAGLDRFEERHWRELERQLGLAPPPDEPLTTLPTPDPEATRRGGLAVSGTREPAGASFAAAG